MDIEQLMDDVRQGRIDMDRLANLIGMLHRQIEKLKESLDDANEKLDSAEQKIEELEKESEAKTGAEKLDQSYSVDAEEKRRRKKKNKKTKSKRKGRIPNAEKFAYCERVEQIYPDNCSPEECWLSHTRVLWRLENGRAVRIAYEIYRNGNRYGNVPGAMGRSEFGLEIVLAIAYQVYEVGLSMDKVCQLMNFFQDLDLSKSQVDTLLNQLSRRWEREFDNLCTLLANSLVVHADETSWSINSVWAFLSEKARVILFGVHKDAATLSELLDPETFAGLVISDDAAVYANFTNAQKCWAHLIRKAIKLTLVAPEDEGCRTLTDGLLEIYHKACRVQRDKRLSDAGREKKVEELDRELWELCGLVGIVDLPKHEGYVEDYRLLCKELIRLSSRGELFQFVLTPPAGQPNGEEKPVSGTNNESERSLRGSALSRATGRANKTVNGARRQTIILSVLESLKNYLMTFTLASVIEEVTSWWSRGVSCFERAVNDIAKSKHKSGVLDAVLPQPDG